MERLRRRAPLYTPAQSLSVQQKRLRPSPPRAATSPVSSPPQHTHSTRLHQRRCVNGHGWAEVPRHSRSQSTARWVYLRWETLPVGDRVQVAGRIAVATSGFLADRVSIPFSLRRILTISGSSILQRSNGHGWVEPPRSSAPAH